jgi:uncharacterized protein with HEPN domain
LKRSVALYLDDILDCISKIEEYSAGHKEESFYADSKAQDAVLRRLEILGEAVKSIPEGFKNAHPAIPWKKIAGLRDVLVHAYFGINLKMVWIVIKTDLPVLKTEISKIRQKIE